MNFIKKISLILLFTVSYSSFYSQNNVLTNDDGLIFIENGTGFYVEGDVLIKNTGVIDNSGTIEVENDWINNSSFNVFLNSSPGKVVLFGNNQGVRGSTPTLFYDLITQNLVTKSLFVDTWVQNKLDITDSEIQLHSNKLHLQNPHPDSLLWNTGFIAGDSLGGYLLRSTDRNSSYIFPVGGLGLLNTYRAIELTPTTSDSSVFGVRLAEINPDNDFSGVSMTGSTGPFPRTQAHPRALEINDKFYHNIARFHGTSNLNTKLYYFQSDEPSWHDFNNLAYWKNSAPRWEIKSFIENTSSGLTTIGNPDRFLSGTISDFSNDVYALVIRDNLDAFVPQIFSPNGDGVNDVLFAFGNRYESMNFIVYNRLGEKVFETSDNSVGWDGKYRGKDAQPGVYVYYLKAKILEEGEITQKGDITLVR